MSWQAALLAALLSQQAPAPQLLPPRPNGWAGLTPQQRAALIATTAERPLAERLLGMSEKFLNTPYVVSPLGEGGGPDPDPTFRLDAVDCLTFVEQTLALSLARRDEDVARLLERIRYAQQPAYEDRNHLMEAQWLPNNMAKGFLVDVTRRYAGADVLEVKKVLTDASWQSKSSAELRLPPERQVKGSYTLNMIPLERVMAHARRLPSGTILVVLRDDLPFKATRVTHLGFVVQKGRRTYLRHAARNRWVLDEDLETFVARNARYTKWKVTGVSLFEPRTPSDGGAVVRSP